MTRVRDGGMTCFGRLSAPLLFVRAPAFPEYRGLGISDVGGFWFEEFSAMVPTD